MWFDLNISKLAVLLTPTFLRAQNIIAYLEAMTAPVTEVLDSFRLNRLQNIYKLQHNGQVCYLRAALNDRFDIQDRRILIDDGNRYAMNYIYTDGEEKPKILGTIYLYEDSDYADNGVDFIVRVPEDLTYNIYEMQALINFYRLASKRYKIVTYIP